MNIAESIDRSRPVLVTGATGYVAGWVVKKLLDEGLAVHAAVRDPDRVEKRQHLDRLAAAAPGTIRYFQADLLEDGSYAEAMKGCQVVFHTASPFITHVKDPRKDLVEPAQLGTRNVLEEVNRTESVRRVVLTSSCAAIYGDSADLEKAPAGKFTENEWNFSSSLRHQPYSYSKMLAEKEAWSIHDRQSRWDLVVVNPSLVLGPGINPNATSESFTLIRQFGDGTMKSGAPDWRIGAVDVRDLAEAHFRAGFLSTAKGRHIISAHDTSFPEIGRLLRERFGNAYPFPERVLPKWLVWLAGPMINPAMTRKAVSRNVGYPWKADNTKSRNELGMEYRPLADSLADFFQQLIDTGVVGRREQAEGS